MPSDVRSFMEPRFGHDFSRVRVHTDAKAAQSARAIQASAYTVGPHIVFGRGFYRPHSTEGRRLLAHELDHLRGQELGGLRLVQRQSGPGYEEGETVAVTLPDLRMATELGGNALAALLHEGDLLQLQYLDPHGEGKVWRAKVLKGKEKDVVGRTGVVRTNWIRPAPESKTAGTPPKAKEDAPRAADAKETPPPPKESPDQQRLRYLASRLFEVQVKVDALAPMMGGSDNLVEQQKMLVAHVDRTTQLLKKAGAGGTVDTSLFGPIEVAIDAAGLAADLMYFDRTAEAAKISASTRRPANRGLAYAWKAMRALADDPQWAVREKAEALETIRMARVHRDGVEEFLRTTNTMKAGVEAAQIVDLVVNLPQLLASGSTILKGLWKWLTEQGGGPGMVRMAGGFGNAVLVASNGKTLVLTVEQVRALIEAGIISGKAAALYLMSKGGTAAGPYGARPPGSPSRFTDKEIAKDIAEETGKVPAGEKAMEEAGMSAKSLRKVEEHHHLLVQQLRRWFKSRGVNIDEFTVPLSADEHRWIHNEYKWNDLWKEFRLKNPQASPDEIMAHMRALMKQVGLEGLDIVPYPY